MHRISLNYTLGTEAAPALIRNPLLDLLQAVSDQGSISAAARQLGLSYRHVWGELRRWDAEFGQPLILWEKGQAARLTDFGAKLLWAERQAQARLLPQIEALRADLERAFAVAFDESAHVLTFMPATTRRWWRWPSARARRGCIWTSAFPAAWMRFARSTRGVARWRAFTCASRLRAAR